MAEDAADRASWSRRYRALWYRYLCPGRSGWGKPTALKTVARTGEDGEKLPSLSVPRRHGVDVSATHGSRPVGLDLDKKLAGGADGAARSASGPAWPVRATAATRASGCHLPHDRAPLGRRHGPALAPFQRNGGGTTADRRGACRAGRPDRGGRRGQRSRRHLRRRRVAGDSGRRAFGQRSRRAEGRAACQGGGQHPCARRHDIAERPPRRTRDDSDRTRRPERRAQPRAGQYHQHHARRPHRHRRVGRPGYLNDRHYRRFHH